MEFLISIPLQTTRLAKLLNELRRKTLDSHLAKRLKYLIKKWRGMIMPSNSSNNNHSNNNSCSSQPSAVHLSADRSQPSSLVHRQDEDSQYSMSDLISQPNSPLTLANENSNDAMTVGAHCDTTAVAAHPAAAVNNDKNNNNSRNSNSSRNGNGENNGSSRKSFYEGRRPPPPLDDSNGEAMAPTNSFAKFREAPEVHRRNNRTEAELSRGRRAANEFTGGHNSEPPPTHTKKPSENSKKTLIDLNISSNSSSNSCQVDEGSQAAAAGINFKNALKSIAISSAISQQNGGGKKRKRCYDMGGSDTSEAEPLDDGSNSSKCRKRRRKVENFHSISNGVQVEPKAKKAQLKQPLLSLGLLDGPGSHISQLIDSRPMHDMSSDSCDSSSLMRPSKGRVVAPIAPETFIISDSISDHSSSMSGFPVSYHHQLAPHQKPPDHTSDSERPQLSFSGLFQSKGDKSVPKFDAKANDETVEEESSVVEPPAQQENEVKEVEEHLPSLPPTDEALNVTPPERKKRGRRKGSKGIDSTLADASKMLDADLGSHLPTYNVRTQKRVLSNASTASLSGLPSTSTSPIASYSTYSDIKQKIASASGTKKVKTTQELLADLQNRKQTSNMDGFSSVSQTIVSPSSSSGEFLEKKFFFGN